MPEKHREPDDGDEDRLIREWTRNYDAVGDGLDIDILDDRFAHLTTDTQSSEGVQEEDEAWRPLARFISKLPALRDLVYACSNQFSPCLLDALHGSLPSCRLHILTFDLRSLHCERAPPETVDPYEYTLATSPCLYSIRVSYLDHDDEQANYNKEAAFEIAAGLAARLKRINMYQIGSSTRPKRFRQGPVWKAIFARDDKERPIQSGGLQCLTLGGLGPIELGDFECWGTAALAKLRCLRLSRKISMRVLARARDYDFRSLETLNVGPEQF